jgi:PfaD family protein
MIGYSFDDRQYSLNSVWMGPETNVHYDAEGIQETLRDLESPCFVVQNGDKIGVTNQENIHYPESASHGLPLLAYTHPLPPQRLGSPEFLEFHNVKLAYMAGSMANGISGPEFVISMGKAGLLASYGAGGVQPNHIEDAIIQIQSNLPEGPYALNLIHSPNEPALEQKTVNLYLDHQVRTVEASAFLRLTPTIVQYRTAGLAEDRRGEPVINNKVIAKISRREVARQFMLPAPDRILRSLIKEGSISKRQAQLAKRVPMADDITVEADSGGHTDNRPMNSLLPSILALREEIRTEETYPHPTRVGAGGGIGTPSSALSAFAMGADYILTGSINQAAVEAYTSQRVKETLSQAASTDVMMAPAADMFEMGAKVQVLKRGTMFPMRALKLYEIYRAHDSLESINSRTRKELEEKIFQRSLDDIWQECVSFFKERDPSQLERAQEDPKRKMALIFRWYLGLATQWGIQGEENRMLDYQIWCGPAMGAFNDWAFGTSLAKLENRHVVDIAHSIMSGAAYLYRLQDLRTQGVSVPQSWTRWLE